MLKRANRTWKIRDDSTLYEVMRVYENLNSQFGAFYDEITENFDFTISGRQWDKEIKTQLEADSRPAFSYNLMRTVLNVIIGIERSNKKKGKASPRTGGDKDLAEVVSETLQYFLYHSGFTEAQKRVFVNKIVGRLGVYHVGWRYNGSTDTNGSLFVESVDPREMAWEPSDGDPLWEKSSFVFRKHELSIEEILNTYALRDEEMQIAIQQEAKTFFMRDPDKGKWINRKLKQMFAAVYETAMGTSGSNVFKNYLQWWNPGNGKFDVLEMHEKRMEKRLFVPDSEGKRLIDITEPYISDFRELNQREYEGLDFETAIIDRVKQRYGLTGEADIDLVNQRFVTAVIPALNIKANEQAYPVNSKYCVYIPDYCYDIHPDPLKLQSVIDDVKDAQKDFNKARSLILELLARYSNKGWVMDEEAISGLEEDWTTTKITPYRRVRSGYMGLIRPEESPTISPELVRMPFDTQQLIKVITNADDEIRGSKSPGVTSGRHFIAKEESQAKSFTILLDNRDRAHKAVYELSLEFIQHYVTAPQVIRITSDVVPGLDADKEVELNKRIFYREPNGELAERVVNDISAYQYDIEISDEPYSASAQIERYNKLGDIFNAVLSVNPQKADAMLPVMLQAAGTPEADKIIQLWEQMSQPNPEQSQMQAMMQKLQMIIAKLGIEEKQATVEGKKLDNAKKIQEIRVNQQNGSREAQLQNVFNLLRQNNDRRNRRYDSSRSTL